MIIGVAGECKKTEQMFLGEKDSLGECNLFKITSSETILYYSLVSLVEILYTVGVHFVHLILQRMTAIMENITKKDKIPPMEINDYGKIPNAKDTILHAHWRLS